MSPVSPVYRLKIRTELYELLLSLMRILALKPKKDMLHTV